MSKFMINFGKEFEKQLDEVSDEKNVTTSEILHRAIATYIYLSKEAKKGNKVAITDPDDKIIKELVYI